MRSLLIVASLVFLNGCDVDRGSERKRAFTEGYYLVDNARESKALVPLLIVRFNSTNTPLNFIYVYRDRDGYFAAHASSSNDGETDYPFPQESIRRGPQTWLLSRLRFFPDRYELKSYLSASGTDGKAPAFDPDRASTVEKFPWRRIEKREAVEVFRSYLPKNLEVRKWIPCAAAFDLTCDEIFRD